MRYSLLIFYLLFVSLNCFTQQNLPARIIGKIPDANNTKTFQIQVGAFSNEKNAESACSRLQKNGLNPATEKYLNFTRVMVQGVPANQVVNFLAIIKQSGFNEVIIREGSPVVSSPTPIKPPDHSESVYSAAFTLDGEQVLSIYGDGTVRLWDISSGSIIETFSGYGNIGRSVNLDSDDAQIISASDDGTVRLLDLSANDEIIDLIFNIADEILILNSP
jgi:hypothetical protein